MLRSPWHSLRIKIIGWSFVPTAIILLAVALVTFYAYQKVAEDLVVGRNQELTRLSASQLASDLGEYTGLLTTLTRNADIAGGDVVPQRIALMNARNRLVVFDAGTVILDSRGRVVAAEPDRPEVLWQDWSNREYFRQMLRTGRPVFSSVVSDGPQGSEVVVVAVPIVGSQSEFRGTMAGMFRLGATSVSAFYGGIVKLRIGESGNTYLVDGNGRVIYHTDPDMVGTDLAGQETVKRALAGRAGEPRTSPSTLNDTVSSFAQVPGTPWTLISEESWDSLMSTGQGYRSFLVILLLLGVLVPALVVTVGVRRITGPIAKLITASQEVAAGNFGRTIAVSTGDELEELAGQFNLMSAELKEFYSDLEQKVADRTRELEALAAENARLFSAEQRRAEQLELINIENARLYEQAQKLAVMEERNRLARDLHDSVTQAVYGVTLYAEAAARLLSSGQTEMAADHLRELRSTAQQALREMRSLIFELRPPVLEKEGLVAALQARLESVEARAGLQVELKLDEGVRLPPNVEEGLYRIAQEALNNILKHAQPRSISLHLDEREGQVLLEIADDGIGFDPVAARESGGLGLRGMEERVARLGGTMEVDSSPGQGTRIRVRVGASVPQSSGLEEEAADHDESNDTSSAL